MRARVSSGTRIKTIFFSWKHYSKRAYENAWHGTHVRIITVRNAQRPTTTRSDQSESTTEFATRLCSHSPYLDVPIYLYIYRAHT